MKEVTAILAADLHIRPDKPTCRTDDFTAAMWRKLEFIFNLSKKNGYPPIFVAGDLGHYHQWPNWMIEKFIRLVNDYKVEIIAIPGQHDLPNHSLKQWRQSAIGVLDESETIKLLGVDDRKLDWIKDRYIVPFPYGAKINDEFIDKLLDKKAPQIAIAHQMVIEDKPLWPGQEAIKGHQLLKKFPNFKLILTGDNHKGFVSEYKGRLLVNPGSMMRTTADQIDHHPRVYMWLGKRSKLELKYIPIESADDVISREHIDRVAERNERIDAYTESLKSGFEIGFDFKFNLEEHFKHHRARRQVKERVWEACEK